MLEAQRDMAGSQCDMARSFSSLLGCFGAFGVEPRRVGGPTRHGGLPMRRGTLFLLPFRLFCRLWAGATSCWKPNATWRAPNATWRTRFAPFLGDLDPWISSHVVLEAQRVMAISQYDVAHSFCSLFGGFGPLELEPRRVGGPTRHGALPMRRGALVFLPFWVFWCLWGGATSCWKPNTTWRTPNPTWRALFTSFWGGSAPLGSSHVVLETQHDMAGSQCDVEGRNTM